MQTNIYYYFEVSNKKQRRLQFKGNGVTARQVIKEILKENKGFETEDIKIYDAQTGMEFSYDEIIKRNTQIVVRRIHRFQRKSIVPIQTAPVEQLSKQKKKKEQPLNPEKELTEEEKKEREEKAQKRDLENERRSMMCKCQRMLIGAYLEETCGETICEKCFESGICPYCGEEVNEDNCSINTPTREAVDLFLSKHPEYRENEN